MTLQEALEVRELIYRGTRPRYEINDPSPNVLILDKSYNVDGNGRSVLGFNINYLDDLDKKELTTLVAKVNKEDAKVVGIGPLKTWLRTLMNIGNYRGLSDDERKKRYKLLVKKFPELKKIIRRYKYDGITAGIEED